VRTEDGYEVTIEPFNSDKLMIRVIKTIKYVHAHIVPSDVGQQYDTMLMLVEEMKQEIEDVINA
jgi:hypothetical protein